MQNVLPLTHPSSRFLLMCFENKLPSHEVEAHFGRHFDIEKLSRRAERVTSRRIAISLLTRNEHG